MTLIALILYVVVLATPQVIHTNTTFAGIGLKSDVGPFKVCVTAVALGESKTECDNINNNCQFQDPNDKNNEGGKVVENCDKFNAARGFLVIGALFSAAALLTMTLIVCTKSSKGFVRGLAIFCALMGAIAGLISMAVFADVRATGQQTGGTADSSHLRLSRPRTSAHSFRFAFHSVSDNKFQDSGSATYLFGFYLIIVAWVAGFLASLPFLCAK